MLALLLRSIWFCSSYCTAVFLKKLAILMAAREQMIAFSGGYDTVHEPIGGTASTFVFGTCGLEPQPGLLKF
jgi:hypothetical protein